MKVKLSTVLIIIASCLDSIILAQGEITTYAFGADTEGGDVRGHVIADSADSAYPDGENDVTYDHETKPSDNDASFAQDKHVYWKRQNSGDNDKIFNFWKKRSSQNAFWKRQGSPKDQDGFWKRQSPNENFGFWKRQLGNQNDLNGFWKRDSKEEIEPSATDKRATAAYFPSTRSLNKSPDSFWKRGYPDQSELSQFWKRAGLPAHASWQNLEDGEGSSFWKRGAGSWNLMRLPEYRSRLSAFHHEANKQEASDLNPFPPMNRRKGPKHNPDFNPTGW